MKGSIKYKKPKTQTSVEKRIESTDRGSIDKLDDTHETLLNLTKTGYISIVKYDV